jgi:hypothetical protein
MATTPEAPSNEADRARLLGYGSLAGSAASMALLMVDLTPGRNPQKWEFLLSMCVAVIAVLLGLAGLDARRRCAEPRPFSPVAGVAIGLLVATFMVLALLFISGIRHL